MASVASRVRGRPFSKRSCGLRRQIPGPGRARDQNHPFNHRDAEAPTLKRDGVLCISVPLWWAVRRGQLSGCEPLGCERHLHHHSDMRPSVATNDWCLISRPPIRNWHSNFPARESAIVNHKSAIQRPCHSTGGLHHDRRRVEEHSAFGERAKVGYSLLSVNVDCWRPAARIAPPDSWVNSSRQGRSHPRKV